MIPRALASRAPKALLLGLCAGLFGCGGTPSSEVRSETSAAEAEVTEAIQKDDVLAFARAEMRQGVIPESVEERILNSDASQHARARRLLETMRNPAPPSLDPTAPQATQGGAQPKGEPAALHDPQAPSEGDAPSEAAGAEPRGDGPVAAVQNPAPTSREAGQGAPGELTVATRLDLKGSAKAVTLYLHAGGALKVGSITQGSSAHGETIRYVVEGAGALPAFLSARPAHKGVRIADVRRGSSAVLVTVELEPGWRAQPARSTNAGAEIRFTR